MDQNNPYASPHSDLTRPASTQVDTSSPFDPDGRFTRLSWLAWNLALGLIAAVAVLVLGTLGMLVWPHPDPSSAPPVIVLMLLAVPQLAAAVIGVLFTIRRFHDINASGWWTATLLVPIANLITFLVLIFKRGDDTANRFGPPRPTRGWEQVLGIIYISLVVIGLVGGIIAAIAFPALVSQMQGMQP